MIKENDSWSLIFNSVQEEDMYEVFWIYSYCAVWNLLHSSGLPSVLYKANFFFIVFINERHNPSYACLPLFQDGTWIMLAALQLQNTAATGSEEMQGGSAQAKVLTGGLEFSVSPFLPHDSL